MLAYNQGNLLYTTNQNGEAELSKVVITSFHLTIFTICHSMGGQIWQIGYHRTYIGYLVVSLFLYWKIYGWRSCPILTLEHATHFNSASIWLVLVILLQTEFWKVKYQNGGNETWNVWVNRESLCVVVFTTIGA